MYTRLYYLLLLCSEFVPQCESYLDPISAGNANQLESKERQSRNLDIGQKRSLMEKKLLLLLLLFGEYLAAGSTLGAISPRKKDEWRRNVITAKTRESSKNRGKVACG